MNLCATAKLNYLGAYAGRFLVGVSLEVRLEAKSLQQKLKERRAFKNLRKSQSKERNRRDFDLPENFVTSFSFVLLPIVI